jgi:hypothetical protein
LRIKDRPMAVEFGLVHVASTRMRVVDALANYCLEMRGPALRFLSVDNIQAPFFKTPTRLRA